MMVVSRRGAISVCSEGVVGAGGTTSVRKDGAERDCSAERLGAGEITELSVSPVREC